MNKSTLVIALLAIGSAQLPYAQEAELTLEEERERIGTEMVENREQIAREISAIREPGLESADQIDEETTLDNTPARPGDNATDATGVGVRNPRFDNSPTGITSPNEVPTLDDRPRPITTPAPLPPDAGDRQAPAGD
ncbi:hypothetical protein HKW98_05575 [Stutzerimonas urumqiensis]|uniref:hypothetical protein n=1 Tax=Stutzerimonas urumqiensis TaxID=638269 RepID=UPI003BA8C892